MTIAELIAALQQLPPDLPVCVNGGLNELANGRPVREIATGSQKRDVSGSLAQPWCYHDDGEDEAIYDQKWFRELYEDYEFRRCVNITS